jgi:hypothetical protein
MIVAAVRQASKEPAMIPNLRSFDLQSHQNEEDRHQSIVDPLMQRQRERAAHSANGNWRLARCHSCLDFPEARIPMDEAVRLDSSSSSTL